MKNAEKSGNMAYLVKYLPHKYENLSLISNQGIHTHTHTFLFIEQIKD